MTSRIILRNTPAFLADYQGLVGPDEKKLFVTDMLDQVTAMFGNNSEIGPQITCVDTGYLYLPHVFDNAVLVATRAGPNAPVDGGWIDISIDAINREKDRFDKVFDGTGQNQHQAVQQLRDFINGFWQ